MKPLSAPNVIETVGVIEVKLLAMESFLFYHRWWVTEYMQKNKTKEKHIWFCKESDEKLYKSSYISLTALIFNGNC